MNFITQAKQLDIRGSMKNLTILFLSLIIMFLAMFSLVNALKNPSSVYCSALGYEYSKIQTTEGEQGICKLPDGSTTDAWNFLKGKEKSQYSFCVENGYGIRTIQDNNKCASISSNECAVCIFNNGTEIEVTKLMGLNFAEGVCGDGVCVLGENYQNCPQDCPPSTTTIITTTTIPAKTPSIPIYIYLIVIGIVIAIVVFLLTRIRVVR